MESNITSLPADPEEAIPAVPEEAFLTEYAKKQQRQYNWLFVVCWLIILITGLITLFLVSGLRMGQSARVAPGL